jgi:hypothetical protein
MEESVHIYLKDISVDIKDSHNPALTDTLCFIVPGNLLAIIPPLLLFMPLAKRFTGVAWLFDSEALV